MTWLLSAMRVPATLLAITLAGLLAGRLRGEAAPMPSLMQARLVPVPVVAVLALVPATATFWGWSSLPWSMTAGSARPVGRLLMAQYIAAPVLFALASWLFGGTGAVLENGRNAFGLLGLAVLGAHWLGERGSALVPITYLLAAFVLGRGAGSAGAYPWAWILNDAGNLLALLLAAVLTIAGSIVVPRLPGVLMTKNG